MLSGLLVADALSPFLPTILLKQVWRNIHSAALNPLEGFSLHAWHWWLVTRVAVYAVLTMLLAVWGARGRTLFVERIKAGALAFGFALCLEVGKLMIVSRTFNSANIVASLLGCVVAVIIGEYLAAKTSVRLKIELASAAILFYVFYLAWTPFDFVRISNIFKRIDFSPVKLLPFYHYAMGAELNHIRLFVQSVFLMGVFIYLLRVRLGWFERNRFSFLTALILAALLGIFAEGGQIFILSRWPSMTDVYCFAIGGFWGASIKRPLSHQVD